MWRCIIFYAFASGYVYVDWLLVDDDSGSHVETPRVCKTMFLTQGVHRVHLIGYNIDWESGFEATYTGPDTYGVRTLIGSTPFFYSCDPRAPMDDALAGFRLCTYQSEPTSPWDGDCTPAVGLAHPRFPGPCGKAIGTVNDNFNYFSGDYVTPVLGSANELWVWCGMTYYLVVVIFCKILN